MSKSKFFNGKLVHDYLHAYPMVWKAVSDILWGGRAQQKKSYFEKKTEINATTLYVLREVTGLPWECFFISEDEEQPDVHSLIKLIDNPQCLSSTFSVDTNPEILLAYINMSKAINDEKDERIANLQRTIDSLLTKC